MEDWDVYLQSILGGEVLLEHLLQLFNLLIHVFQNTLQICQLQLGSATTTICCA